MNLASGWYIFSVVVSTVAVVFTAWMAYETRKMATVANKALEIERMPILGLRDIKIELYNNVKGDDLKGGEFVPTGIRLGLELFNAGRVPIRYKVNNLSVSFANRVSDLEKYLSRGGQVLPGSSIVFWHSGIHLDPPITKFPNKGRAVIDCEYSSYFGDDPKLLRETVEFTLDGATPGSRINWLYVDESTKA
jgi:hypothetical protein